MMTPEPTPLAPAAAALPASHRAPREESEGEDSWRRAITNPQRNALMAAAAETISETARRIADLQARLETLSNRTSAPVLS